MKAETVFPVVSGLLLLAIVAWLFGQMIAYDLEWRRRRRESRAAYLGRVGILLPMDAPSLDMQTLNTWRIDRYEQKRAGLVHWRVLA